MDSGAASLSELKDVLKEALHARGSLGQIKARIRAEIFASLDDQEVPAPKLSNENLIVNELIREYLEYNGYRHTLSVFMPESGQPVDRVLPREFLAAELNVTEDPYLTKVPLLYNIVVNLQQQKEASTNQAHEKKEDVHESPEKSKDEGAKHSTQSPAPQHEHDNDNESILEQALNET